MNAFLPVQAISAEDHADALLELAFLVTAADGKLAKEEADAFRELVARVRGKAASDDELGALYTKFTKALDGTSCIDRVKLVAPKLPADLREAAFRVAMALALIDRDASPQEDALIDVLFHSLGLDEARAEEVAKEVRVALSPPLDSPPPA
ncbi:MAG: TerB family tellurite resistance protein [Labilithrix sp.]|nr:TerB family tellurite resistance protein [Labilithrix sp.]MCW5812454.1 TerB family tellurite resistance protein [Labilithrix sp.]